MKLISGTSASFTGAPPLLLNLEKEKITIKCSHGQMEFDETISRDIYEPKLVCPGCNEVVKVDLLELHNMLESARKQTGNVLKKLAGRSSGKRSANWFRSDLYRRSNGDISSTAALQANYETNVWRHRRVSLSEGQETRG